MATLYIVPYPWYTEYMNNNTNTYQITFYVPTSRQRYQVVMEGETCLATTNKCIGRYEVPGARISVEVCKQVPNDREVRNITAPLFRENDGRITRDLDSRSKMPTITEGDE